MIGIRRANTDDVAAAARCHVACWREGYAGILSEDQLVLDLPLRLRMWSSMVAADSRPWVATEDDAIIGLAKAGPGRDDDIDLDLELILIYARQAHWGTGVGHRLIEAAIGDQSAYLWVFGNNARAIRFYQRHGFTPDGTEKPHARLGAIELRMTRR